MPLPMVWYIPFTLVSLEKSRSSRSLLVRRNVSELVREDSGEEEDLMVHSAIAASIVRLAVIMAITSRGFDYTEDEDLTVGTALYWGMIETGLALVAACLPTVSSGITKPFGRLISTTRSLFSPQSRSTKTGSSAKGIQSANQYYEMDQTSIAASKLSTGAQSREGEANFRTEEHFTGDIEAARLRP
ncbi:hypothetical protein ACHAQE_002968 [Botrytis cinerea]